MCESDASCAGGVCVNGYCAFGDDDCKSGYRFGAHATIGIANQCVRQDESAADTDNTLAPSHDDPGSGETATGTSSSSGQDAPSTDPGAATEGENSPVGGDSTGAGSESSSSSSDDDGTAAGESGGDPSACVSDSCDHCLECATTSAAACGPATEACEADGADCMQAFICLSTCALSDECGTECCAGVSEETAGLALVAYACATEVCFTSGCIDVPPTCNAGG